MVYGFIRTACASPRLKVADCAFNEKNIVETAKDAAKNDASVIVFPELSITGYTCGDLFFQESLQREAEKQLVSIIKQTEKLGSLIFVGLPLPRTEGIYNCAAAICNGQLLAIYVKSFLPNYGEFYERRQFTPFQQNMETQFISFAGFENIPFGTDILIQDEANPSLTIACELCEDLWVPVPPSSRHVLAGATLIANLSAGNEIIGKAEYRRSLVKSQSARSICSYLYANAGMDESTQDMVFAGHNLIVENGTVLAESALFSNEIIYADIDVERLCQERRKTTSFGYSVNNSFLSTDYITISVNLKNRDKFTRNIDPHPFVPNDVEKRTQRCLEVITLQYQGLAKRLRHINCQSAVIGLSGGVCTHDLIQTLYGQGYTVLLPSVVGNDLALHIYEGEDAMNAGASFGIQESNGTLFTDLASIDLAVIPGMAFTPQGDRLGRGKGFYDRLLPQLHCPLIGLAFPFQILPSIPTEVHDIRMTEVITC